MTQPAKSKATYPVGYKKPPAHGQFKKGQSGNRAGRTKDRGNWLTLFKKVAAEKVTVNVDGQRKTMTRGEAVIFVNRVKALQGNRNAFNNMYMLAEEFKLLRDITDVKQVGGLLGISQPTVNLRTAAILINAHGAIMHQRKEMRRMEEERKEAEKKRQMRQQRTS